MEKKIILEGITKSFKDKKVLENFSLTVMEGEMIALVGPSGCGKSTILNIIGTLDQQFEGSMLVNGEELKHSAKKALHFRRDYLGYLFQNFALMDDETVEKNLKIVSKNKDEMIKALESVGLIDVLDKYVYTLSGGQQQRVAMARLMLKQPEIILADEPTGSLDEENGKRILEILTKMKQDKKTIIVVTHEKNILSYFDRVIEIT